MAAASFWATASGPDLAQGDLLLNCAVPSFAPDFGEHGFDEQVPLDLADLIIVTQSCDLAHGKNEFVALCPVHSLAEFEEVNPKFAQKGMWEQVRTGRIEGLHMLASPEHPTNNRAAFVVNFRQIFSLPVGYLERHADSLGDRWRLQPPFLEHFSQGFARFFMRVGSPLSIPPFR